MGQLRVVVAAAVVALAVGGCSDDDGGGSSVAAPTDDVHGSNSLDLGELDLDVPDGYQPIPLTSLGIGFGIPQEWQGTVLTDEAYERLEDIPGIRPFLESARNAERSGAVFYAAGPDGDGIADLKLQVLPDDVPLIDLAMAAQDVAPKGAQVLEQPDEVPPRIRLDFGAGGPHLPAAGTQWFVEGTDDPFSLIVTSEDKAAHDDLATTIVDSVVFS
jgi:hypothetical protein